MENKRFEPLPIAGKPGTATQLSSNSMGSIDGTRKFIRTANAQFSVKDVYLSAFAIEDAVAAHGGFVTNNRIASNVLNSRRFAKGEGISIELAEYTVQGSLSVRIPSNKTLDFLRVAAAQIEFLDQRNFEAHDAQFDLLRQHFAYVRNQETQEELGNLTREGGKLGQKADIVAARNDTKAARDEAKVSQQELEDRVAFSTIDFSLSQPARVRQTESVDSDAMFQQHRPGFFTSLAKAFEAGWNGSLDILISLVRAWPLWVAGAALLLALQRCLQRRSFGNNAKRTPEGGAAGAD